MDLVLDSFSEPLGWHLGTFLGSFGATVGGLKLGKPPKTESHSWFPLMNVVSYLKYLGQSLGTSFAHFGQFLLSKGNPKLA